MEITTMLILIKQKEPRIAAQPFLENPHLIPNTSYCDSGLGIVSLFALQIYSFFW